MRLFSGGFRQGSDDSDIREQFRRQSVPLFQIDTPGCYRRARPFPFLPSRTRIFRGRSRAMLEEAG
jgi:hypothetical protein